MNDLAPWRLDRKVAVVTLNRPDVRNAVDLDTLDAIEAALDSIEIDSSVTGVVFTGAGSVFSAGGDIRAMRDLQWPQGRVFVERGQAVLARIEHSRLFSIAAINGHALGGGLELALACDLRVASRGALLGFPEVTLGLLPGWGGTQRAVRAIGPSRSKWMVLSGGRISADAAAAIGLVDEVVDPAAVLDRALDMSHLIAANSPMAVEQSKRAIVEGADLPLDVARRLEIECWMVNLASPNRVEGLTAFLERRTPQWTT